MKKKILVPTDFSETSHNAYLYARELAKVYNCTLEVVHAYSTSLSNNSVISLMASEGTVKTVKKEMERFIDDYSKGEGTVLTKVNVNTNIAEDSPVSMLVKESAAENVLMVVMGASDKHDTVERLVGSISSKVAQKAHCPVMLIPQSATYQDFNNILYASNFEASQETVVKQVADFANIFRSAIHFVHVEEEGESEDFLLTEEKIFGSLFKEGNPAFSFSMNSVKADTVEKGLYDYARQNDIELIVIANRQRSFVDSIWGKSLSMKMALNIKFPLLVYHL